MPRNQKNVFALCFDLPKSKVQLHDSWPLDVHFIVRPGLEGDSSFRRGQVTLQELKRQGQEQIAVLHYDFTEFVSGKIRRSPEIMAVSYRAVAEFSITRGRWLRYSAIASMPMAGDHASPIGPVRAHLLFTMQPE